MSEESSRIVKFTCNPVSRDPSIPSTWLPAVAVVLSVMLVWCFDEACALRILMTKALAPSILIKSKNLIDMQRE